MNTLQRIIQKTPSNLPVTNSNPVFVENEDLGEPIFTETTNPSTETFLTGIPMETMPLSVTDSCINLYSKWLKFETFLGDLWESGKSLFLYRKDYQCAKELAKLHEEKKRLFISHQVKAMVGHIIDFNTENTRWNTNGKDKVLCFRNFHKHHHNHDMIINRNISRHWNTNHQQALIA